MAAIGHAAPHQSSAGMVSDFGRFVQLPRRERSAGDGRRAAAGWRARQPDIRRKCRQKRL